MTTLEIQYEFKKKGITQKNIALNNKVSEMSISKVVHKKLISDRLMRIVAGAINSDHRKVFSEYYLQKPKRKTSKVAAM